MEPVVDDEVLYSVLYSVPSHTALQAMVASAEHALDQAVDETESSNTTEAPPCGLGVDSSESGDDVEDDDGSFHVEMGELESAEGSLRKELLAIEDSWGRHGLEHMVHMEMDDDCVDGIPTFTMPVALDMSWDESDFLEEMAEDIRALDAVADKLLLEPEVSTMFDDRDEREDANHNDAPSSTLSTCLQPASQSSSGLYQHYHHDRHTHHKTEEQDSNNNIDDDDADEGITLYLSRLERVETSLKKELLSIENLWNAYRMDGTIREKDISIDDSDTVPESDEDTPMYNILQQASSSSSYDPIGMDPILSSDIMSETSITCISDMEDSNSHHHHHMAGSSISATQTNPLDKQATREELLKELTENRNRMDVLEQRLEQTLVELNELRTRLLDKDHPVDESTIRRFLEGSMVVLKGAASVTAVTFGSLVLVSTLQRRPMGSHPLFI
jgi:hypothetical protein